MRYWVLVDLLNHSFDETPLLGASLYILPLFQFITEDDGKMSACTITRVTSPEQSINPVSLFPPNRYPFAFLRM